MPKHALRTGFTIEEIFNHTKIARWSLVQIKEIVDFEEELAAGKELKKMRCSVKRVLEFDGSSPVQRQPGYCVNSEGCAIFGER